MKWLICWLRGQHTWEPPVRRVEYWYCYEEVGERGGLYLEHAQSPTPVEDGYTLTYEARRCSCCGRVEDKLVA
jgi:hypothetical protein